jgi:hypothetical protein
VRCAAAKPRVNAEKPRFFINTQKKIDGRLPNSAINWKNDSRPTTPRPKRELSANFRESFFRPPKKNLVFHVEMAQFCSSADNFPFLESVALLGSIWTTTLIKDQPMHHSMMT